MPAHARALTHTHIHTHSHRHTRSHARARTHSHTHMQEHSIRPTNRQHWPLPAFDDSNVSINLSILSSKLEILTGSAFSLIPVIVRVAMVTTATFATTHSIVVVQTTTICCLMAELEVISVRGLPLSIHDYLGRFQQRCQLAVSLRHFRHISGHDFVITLTGAGK